MVTAPLFGAVQEYHTEWIGPGPESMGSFVSPVAPWVEPAMEPSSPVTPTLLPATTPLLPDRVVALAKLSLVGTWAGPSIRVAEAAPAHIVMRTAAAAKPCAAVRASLLQFVRRNSVSSPRRSGCEP